MRRVSAGNLGSWRMPLVLSVLDQGLVSGAHFGLNVVLARWTSPAEYGVFAVTFGIFLLLSGLHVALILEPMNVFGAARPPAELGRYVGSLVLAHIALTVPLALVLAAAALGVRGRSGALAGSIAALAAALPLLLLQWLLRQACYVQTRPDLALRGSLVYVSTLAGVFALEVLGPVAVSPLQAAFPALGMASLAAAAVLWRPLGVPFGPWSAPPRDVVASHWAYGRWILAASIAHNAGNALYLPLVATLLGLASSGILKAVQNLALPLQQVLAALNLLALPGVSRQRAVAGATHARRAVLALVLAYVAVAALYGAVLAGFGGRLLRLLYGGGPYAGYGWGALLVAVAGVLSAAAQALGVGLRAMGRPPAILWSKLAAASFLLAVGTVLVARRGLYGALWGIVLGSACEAVVLALFMWKKG